MKQIFMRNDYGLPLGDLLHRIDPNYPHSRNENYIEIRYEPPKESRGTGSSILDEIESVFDEENRTNTSIWID